ncbi:acetyltransferase [Baekduia alba]|uniref:GNAT family N-acetyltransferase n=1 Tax=Baekduia alba TaxID=2997333 RepID=UPI002340F6AD|nr:GNAT family N-acetyltransferase [Baekduia alba]WCB93746.1 acetyltransferase [Baekduia alba]
MIDARTVPSDAVPATTLVAAMVDEVSELYGRIDAPGAPSATPVDFSEARGGVFVVLFEDGEPVAGGGVKRLDDTACEIKRMYVVPEARGRGLASQLLVALEDAARAGGYAIARLDTGPRQPEAQAMYERAGYAPIGNFNANPFASFWGEKAL